MDTRSDVIIIGGGIIGCTLADTLCQQSLSVRIIDAGKEVPAATHSAAGMLAPSAEFGSTDNPVTAMGLASLEAWPALAERLKAITGIDPDFRPFGTLTLTRRDAGAPCPSQPARQPKAITAYPDLDVTGLDTDFVAHEAQIDPVLTLRALRTVLSTHKTFTWTTDQVTSVIEATGTSASVQTRTGKRYDAGALVFANGAGLSRIDTSFELPTIVPVKGAALALEQPLPVGFPVVRSGAVYLCPRSDGRLIVGASEQPGDASLTVDATIIEGLRQRATALLPALASSHEHHRWAGVRPGTPDHTPYIGRSDTAPPSILFAVGHYRNG
ncbi:MAG: FAD-dependent oxidoreductase, partial [Pseudomonadota bacterium]